MTITSLFAVPDTPEGWLRWSLSHRLDHDLIRQAIQAKIGINLNQYELDPIPVNDFQRWLQRNQKAHSDFTAALGQQGSDLLTLDPTDPTQLAGWINEHYLEHLSAHQALGI